MKTFITEQLVSDAFLQAVGREQPPTVLIVHTYQGSQSTSRRHQEVVKRHGGVIIMSRLGDPYDNAVMESFYKTLKSELLAEEILSVYYEAEKAVMTKLRCFTKSSACISCWVTSPMKKRMKYLKKYNSSYKKAIIS